MGTNCSILYADHSWNPWVGCTEVSEGCENCEMIILETLRSQRDPHEIRRTRNRTFSLPQTAQCEPGDKVTVCNWSDFFHQDADEWRDEAWEMIRRCNHLSYIIITKRPHRIMSALPSDWGDGYPHVCLGVTVENQRCLNERWPILREIPAAVHALGYEPALTAIELPADFLLLGQNAWVIAGGEKAPRRPCPRTGSMRPEWIRRVRDQCVEADVPMFFTRWGGRSRRVTSRLVDGEEWSQFPPALEQEQTQTQEPNQ